MLFRSEHLSLYGLTLSELSPWGREAAAGKLAPLDDDQSADQLELALELLTSAGFEHYEIANFARPGYASRHNLAYWRRENYLGLGVAAASCIATQRWSNVRDIEEYAELLAREHLPRIEQENLSIEEVLAEAMFLGLRLQEGIVFERFQEIYGTDPRRYFKKQVRKLEQNGLLQSDERHMWLTRRGMMLGNAAFQEFV